MSQWNKFFNLRIDSASYEEINERVTSDSMLKGGNSIILVMAILTASIGLNMNSTAVVIGAMLMSPLMGALVAIGFGMATYDTKFIKSSMIKLSFQIFVSLVTSMIYFTLSPISNASSEILTRTAPTAWDVLIALSGGLAGAIGNTRQEKSNVIPGVAIATALMPPLCTAGYGLSSGVYSYFLGAMYLFFINSFFIILSAFIIFKLLRVPPKKYAEDSHKNYQKGILVLLGILITVPSIYMAYLTVDKTIRDDQIQTFLATELNMVHTSIVSYAYEDHVLTLDLIGRPLTEGQINRLEESMQTFNRLKGTKLKVVQGYNAQLDSSEVQQIINKSMANMMAKEKGKSYKELANTYYPAYQRSENNQEQIRLLNNELPILFPEIKLVKLSPIISVDDDGKVIYSGVLVTLIVRDPLTTDDVKKIQRWIVEQVGDEVSLIVQLEEQPSQFYGNGIK
ncbi:DUF389 domain-containing protein [Veillonella intestinalis]|uniref:DUF389 domain-containing protein n=1 Tax=Veillonella intestinalis TaxID=2941341 RepID=UPI0020418206|nr:DUF389 domain-containing protein [Veillonella intestinalis]